MGNTAVGSENTRANSSVGSTRRWSDPIFISEKNIAAIDEKKGGDVPVISQRKKWSLLLVFCLGFFIDVWSSSAFFIFTDPISEDLGVPLAQQSWVIVSASRNCH